jgi:predicted dithiol-disulfide oxidoreductase (DUF899 family)
MEYPQIASREEWLKARMAFQTQEDAAADVLAQLSDARQNLPMVEITGDYIFDTPDGPKSLIELFEGRNQLIVYHFMYGPDWDKGCPVCSFNMDNLGDLTHLRANDTNFVVISRAPLAKLEAWKERMGWTFPWVSSSHNTFNQDFFTTLSGSEDPVNYMYKTKAELDAIGDWYFTEGEQGATSVFVRDGDRVFQTFSSYFGKLDLNNGLVNYLDLTPRGRDNLEIHYHDSYPTE